MSLLLDALRKSEDRRRMGRPPGLDLPSTAGMGRPAPRSRRAVWIVPALVVAAAVGGTAWWLFAEPEPAPEIADRTALPEALPETLPESPAAAIAPPELPADAEPVAASGPGERPAQEAELRRAGPSRIDEPPVTGELAEGHREPVVVPEPAGEAPAVAAAESTEPAAPPVDPEPAPVETEPEAGPEPASGPLEPGAPEYVQHWDLPLGIRQNLPDLKLTVHVFAPRPEDRFVLINGERWVEGDELASGLVLHEINRDGAVFNYRQYRFLLE